jgi:hypothetical protein
MVKAMKLVVAYFLSTALCVNGGLADEPLSPAAIKDRELTPELTKALPHRDCSTPSSAFLGFLRSSVEASIRDYMFYLTPDARRAKTGVEQENAISDAKVHSFAEAYRKAGFQKIRLEEFQTFPVVAPTQIVAVVASIRGKMAVREKYNIGVIQTNGQWKFSSVDVSVIDRNPADK